MARALSITAAQPGWVAVYDDGAGQYEVPVVLWALVEDEEMPGMTFPSAFSADVNGNVELSALDYDDPNFVCYRFKQAT